MIADAAAGSNGGRFLLHPVMSQRMLIFNTTGNSTDAEGSGNITNSANFLTSQAENQTSDLAQKENKLNMTQIMGSKYNNMTALASEYPAKINVTILGGAALKGETAFSPNPVKINTGGTVTWINKDIVTHTITYGRGFSDPEMGKYFDSGLMGGKYSKKLDKAGEYPYFCQVHPQMVGKIIVRATDPADLISRSSVKPPPANDTASSSNQQDIARGNGIAVGNAGSQAQ